MINSNINDYNDIYEELLDENIPRDLYQAYDMTPYDSQRNPLTRHYEVQRGRRTATYDYGKAKYKVISPDDAIRLVKQNKNEVQNLRILYNGKLVEYEVRDNGAIYAIYRSLDPVTINGKNYKNIGYAPWQAVIRAADKIYWTDEYSKLLSPERIDKRKDKYALRTMYRAIRPGEPGYDPHTPYTNIVRGTKIQTKAVPDTGDHANIDGQVKEKYINYDLARKALRKLELEKDSYDEEEYQELKAKFEQIKNNALREYEDALKQKRIRDTKKVKEIPLFVHNFHNKILAYTRQIQKALSDSYRLKQRLDKLLTTTANTASDIDNRLKLVRLRTNLINVMEQLKIDEDTLNKAESELDTTSEEAISDALKSIASYKKQYTDTHVEEILRIEKQMNEIEELIATYRPNTTARKAKNNALNTKELDPDLENIIDFTSF